MDENDQYIVDIPVNDAPLEGELVIPEEATGLVIFVHGSVSSRHSPRNNFVAETLRERGLATLLFDLLTEAEDEDRENRFDISLLTERLVAVSHWLKNREDTRPLSFGYFVVKYRCCRSVAGSSAGGIHNRRRRVERRPGRFGGRSARYSRCRNAVHRRRKRRECSGTQSGGIRGPHVRKGITGSRKCWPPL